MTENTIAKRNDVSQSMDHARCPITFQRSVTVAVTVRVRANTVTNSTTESVMFIGRAVDEPEHPQRGTAAGSG
jgi:hypothetical protein